MAAVGVCGFSVFVLGVWVVLVKVILTAFCGKLKSDPMDWPENQPPVIRMMLDYSPPPITSPQLLSDLPILKKGTFEATSRWFPIAGSREIAAEYVLVDIS